MRIVTIVALLVGRIDESNPTVRGSMTIEDERARKGNLEIGIQVVCAEREGQKKT